MSQPVIQTSFNAGEWAPALNARVDLTKYHSGAAVLRNFFVDYRGGATTRPGTRYITTVFKSGSQVRLIPFQASFSVSYILEFGDLYIRFISNGVPVLETATSITSSAGSSPVVFTDTAHGYSNGDWIFLSGSYYIVQGVTTNTFTLTDLQGNVINTNPFTLPIAAARVYTLASPYLATELSQVKFSQNVNQLILCHPNHAPYVLTLITFNSWTLAPITFGSTVAAPTGLGTSSTLGAGSVNYAYVITSVDANGQESAQSTFATLTSLADIRTTGGTNTVTWSAVAAASSYNVYRAVPTYGAAVASGSQFGFVGNVTGTTFQDSNIIPDFTQGPPVVLNPFFGSGVKTVTLTSGGLYGSNVPVPTITFTASPLGPSQTATASASLAIIGVSLANAGIRYVAGDIVNAANGVVMEVTSVGGGGAIASYNVLNSGNRIYSGNTNTNPVSSTTSGAGQFATFNYTWTAGISLTFSGSGYISTPTITFNSGSPPATATAALGAASAGNPTVPGFFDQRLVLAGPPGNPQQFNMSQPGNYFNFNVNNPIEGDDAIQASLVSGKLNSIKSMITMPSGLVLLSDQQAWLVNGGSAGSGISALQIAANSQAYNGASDLPPIVASYDILYVQAKTSIVRDLAYNFYTNVYAGANISTLSSHLFYGFTLLEWCWAEEPFKLVWAVRNDGTLLSLTFQKDQEVVAWARHDTSGTYKSIACVTEVPATGPVDAVYTIVQRSVNGVSVQYIERMVELFYPQGFKSSWYLDAGISYSGAPATTFSGAQHLSGLTVTGVADGVVIPPFTMPTNGTFTLGVAASLVTVGIPITGQIQTLALDLGEPTVQGKRKKIAALTVRAANTLGIQCGRSFSTLTNMKDFIIGNLSTMTNTIVTDLVTGDGRTIVDPLWDVPGQLCIQQTQPFPASVLGVVPEIEVGDDH